ncbi:AbrB family transcriptional regulator [Viridibacillus sp. FSL H7-0596]|uniref:AbrB family transcriptional regulator n=1 Tax=Viridibacillus arenosi FSL R5-213 TaxID=1227360 RepID=W4EWJ2_9BACL|nr:AbrB family transcriptional regulator [Viridibacillus arenosi FSL R5-213]OMC87431.1 AbrB family transcriptional regulator [Viridibacillus sp. FSL H7-0596]OMC90001.1 AbrB family transcriptional regulator [Viridibacillus arenosi]
MKSTGIVRKVDELGRVVIPVELRRGLGIGERDPLEIYVDGNQIVLQKYQPNVEREDVTKGLEKLKELVSSTDKDVLERAIKLIK